MRVTIRRSLCVLAMCLAWPVAADTGSVPELFVPVEAPVLERFAQKTNYALREKLYFAKRHRIVRINFDLLDRDAQTFTITPFDDLAVKVRTRETAAAASLPDARLWKGQFLDPAGGEAEISFWVSLETRDVHRALRRQIEQELSRQDAPRMSGARPGTPAAAAGRRGPDKIRVRTLAGTWRVPSSRSVLRIEPVYEDPRFHVVYEEDPEKLVYTSENRAEKARRLHAFRQQLRKERERNPED